MMNRRAAFVRTTLIAAFMTAFACASTTAPALHAQGATATNPLAAIDSLLAHSRFRDAAAALDKWERDNSNRITPAQRATALLLRARMITNADSARALYLQISLGYPSSPEAPIAFLRLGQIAHAAGDMTRARSYFQRVVSDYPDAATHADAVAWLGRPGVTGPGRTRASLPASANQPYSVQIGAFRDKISAAASAKKLTQLGFAARVASVKGSTLVRVRIGRFATSREAADEVRRLRTAGYEAVVVDDASEEQE
ncbi:MAG: SPOR domain-containing protein [Longimicrobiales bacterium]